MKAWTYGMKKILSILFFVIFASIHYLGEVFIFCVCGSVFVQSLMALQAVAITAALALGIVVSLEGIA